MRDSLANAMTDAVTKRPSGLDLQFERKTAGLTQDQVAARLGVTRQRVAAIEGARLPSLKATEQYLVALAGVALVRAEAGDVDLEADRAAVIEMHARSAALVAVE